MLDEYICEKEYCQYLKNKRDKFFLVNSNFRKKFKNRICRVLKRQNLCSSLLFLRNKKSCVFFSLLRLTLHAFVFGFFILSGVNSGWSDFSNEMKCELIKKKYFWIKQSLCFIAYKFDCLCCRYSAFLKHFPKFWPENYSWNIESCTVYVVPDRNTKCRFIFF